jgi:hypothetical protein
MNVSMVLSASANGLLLLVPDQSTSLSILPGYPTIQLLREASEIFGKAS